MTCPHASAFRPAPPCSCSARSPSRCSPAWAAAPEALHPDGSGPGQDALPDVVTTDLVGAEDAVTARDEGADRADTGPSGDGPAADQTGTPPLVIAAWNLRGYPASAAAPAVLSAEVVRLGIDVLAAPEVADPGAFSTLAADLGGFGETVIPAQAPGDDSQIGLLWREARVSVTGVEAMFTDDPTVFPRPAVVAEVTPLAAPSHAFTLVAVHLKAGTDPADEALRAQAVARLEQLVRSRGEPDSTRLFVIGDFNEAPSDPMAAQVMGPFLDAPERYQVPTWALAKAGAVTFLPAQIMLDHAAATSGLASALGEPVIPPLDDAIAGYETEVSDHLPIVLKLSLD